VEPYVLPWERLISEEDSDEEPEAAGDGESAVEDGRVGATQSPSPNPEHLEPRAPPPLSIGMKQPQDLFAYFLLRGQNHASEGLYNIIRQGWNDEHPLPLPCANTLRYGVAPQVEAKWMLQTKTCTAQDKDGNVVAVRYVPPSEHVRRDFAFQGTFERFLASDARAEGMADLEPEFIDTPCCLQRVSHTLAPSGTVPVFQLDGQLFHVGQAVDVSLADGRVVPGAILVGASFLAAVSGLERHHGKHAGDLVLSVGSGHGGGCAGDGGDGGEVIVRHWHRTSFPSMSWASAVAEPMVTITRFELSAVQPEHHAIPNIESPPVGRPRRGFIDGMPYTTLYLRLNSDDFNPRTGKPASLGGVYMDYLLWLYADRCSSHAARTIAATPPGISSDVVLDAITSDVVTGATQGWVVETPDRKPLRVFADLVCFVGDYLQVSKTSKMMGSSATAPCSLCSYRLREHEGSRYGMEGSAADAELLRTTFRTSSVCRAFRDAWKGLHGSDEE